MMSDSKLKQLYGVGMARKISHHASGIKARNTIIAKHGEGYYARIGKKVVAKPTPDQKASRLTER